MKTISFLYERHNYLNRNIEYLINTEIIEYDIKSAGFNIIKSYGLMEPEDINKMEKMNKKKRQIFIGKRIRNDKPLSKRISECFVDIRKQFFEENQLTDADVVSIKKDAIYTLRRCRVLDFGGVEFVDKNIYTSYYYLNKKEFYYNSFNDTLDIKGISDEVLEYHREFMVDFLIKLFKAFEISDQKYIIRILRDFMFHYKNKDLPVGYYRELNADSYYSIMEEMITGRIILKDIDEDDINHTLDIGYNYIMYLLPIMRILI